MVANTQNNASTDRGESKAGLSGEWQINLAMYRAALAAGFKVSPIKSLEGREGLHWKATLSHHGDVAILASNDGDGGQDWIVPAYEESIEACKPAKLRFQRAREALWALPEVQFFLQSSKTFADVSSPEDADALGHVIASLAEIRAELPRLKRLAASGLHWVESGHEFGTCATMKGAIDTPAQRERVQAKWPASFIGFQGWLPDLIAGL